jgi:hypothetical protein
MSGRRESTDQRYKNYSILLNYLKDRGVSTVPIDLKSLSSGNLVCSPAKVVHCVAAALRKLSALVLF